MKGKATTLYFPHGGGPLPLLDDPGHANMVRFLRAFADTVERPEAIVVVSAHWERPAVTITAAPKPGLLFDYHGFPPESYEYRYPAPGDPTLAGRVDGLLRDAGIESRLDVERGFDHGLFVPLLLMYPQADIPCIQVSLRDGLDAAEHLAVGKALSALGDEPLLILGSGFSFHNMRELMSKRDDADEPRNQAFEDWLAETCCSAELSETERETRLIEWESAPHARFCHPREEHLLPLQVCYGIAGGPATRVFAEKVAGFMASAYRWN